MKTRLSAWLLIAASTGTIAAPVTYNMDPDHTYPSFEADHMGGLSVLRGKFTKTTGAVVIDKDAGTGIVDATIDASTLDFGNAHLNEHAKGTDMFDVAKYPTATYHGTFSAFRGGTPTDVQGNLTLHGVTKPVTLHINQFSCRMHAFLKREVCGADASATFNRDDFGIDFGKGMGFNMSVKLLIEVEAIKAE